MCVLVRVARISGRGMPFSCVSTRSDSGAAFSSCFHLDCLAFRYQRPKFKTTSTRSRQSGAVSQSFVLTHRCGGGLGAAKFSFSSRRPLVTAEARARARRKPITGVKVSLRRRSEASGVA